MIHFKILAQRFHCAVVRSPKNFLIAEACRHIAISHKVIIFISCFCQKVFSTHYCTFSDTFSSAMRICQNYCFCPKMSNLSQKNLMLSNGSQVSRDNALTTLNICKKSYCAIPIEPWSHGMKKKLFFFLLAPLCHRKAQKAFFIES